MAPKKSKAMTKFQAKKVAKPDSPPKDKAYVYGKVGYVGMYTQFNQIYFRLRGVFCCLHVAMGDRCKSKYVGKISILPISLGTGTRI